MQVYALLCMACVCGKFCPILVPEFVAVVSLFIRMSDCVLGLAPGALSMALAFAQLNWFWGLAQSRFYPATFVAAAAAALSAYLVQRVSTTVSQSFVHLRLHLSMATEINRPQACSGARKLGYRRRAKVGKPSLWACMSARTHVHHHDLLCRCSGASTPCPSSSGRGCRPRSAYRPHLGQRPRPSSAASRGGSAGGSRKRRPGLASRPDLVGGRGSSPCWLWCQCCQHYLCYWLPYPRPFPFLPWLPSSRSSP